MKTEEEGSDYLVDHSIVMYVNFFLYFITTLFSYCDIDGISGLQLVGTNHLINRNRDVAFFAQVERPSFKKNNYCRLFLLVPILELKLPINEHAMFDWTLSGIQHAIMLIP
jgi:hypothetical protein